jgi:hypothetical protein
MWEVWAFIRLGREQVKHCCWDVLCLVGGWRGGVGVEEIVVGVEGGDDVGVLDFTSSFYCAGWVPRCVAAWHWYGLLRPSCIPSFDFSGFSYCGGGRWSCVAQIGPFEGFYLCMVSPAWSSADEGKLGSSRHYLSRGSLLRVWIWRRRIGSTPIPLVRCF